MRNIGQNAFPQFGRYLREKLSGAGNVSRSCARSWSAATLNGARVLGIEGRTGTIAVDREADLIVVDRNPLEDLRSLFEPLLVVTDGKMVLDRLYPDVYAAR